jgi:Pyridoxamine-phosphate oxidase
MIKCFKTGERTMKNEFDNLKVMHEYAWSLIIRGTVDKKSPALHPTFGTVGLKGMPELRTVVLRQANQIAATLEVHTDLKSKKVEELKLNPKVGLHIWFPKNKLQIRLKAISEIKTGETLREKWDKVPYKSTYILWHTPSPWYVDIDFIFI